MERKDERWSRIIYVLEARHFSCLLTSNDVDVTDTRHGRKNLIHVTLDNEPVMYHVSA